jgi:caffeoyl-CoA O-methyltransferase
VFHNMPEVVRNVMKHLEERDKQDRLDGTPHSLRLRQIPRETGQLLAILAASAPPGTYLEIGTSGGYSTLWLGVACRELGRRITTIEISEEKARHARRAFAAAGLDAAIECVTGDARELLKCYSNISFCFLDADKDVYSDCYEEIVARMVSGGLLVADNILSHAGVLESFTERALHDNRVDALVIPIGTGELLCRKI